MGPAATIIEICGGHDAVAEWLGVNVSRVYRWTYPKTKDGSDGYIPSQYHQTLLLRARSEGKDLRPEHFFPDYAKSAAVTQRENRAKNHPSARRPAAQARLLGNSLVRP